MVEAVSNAYSPGAADISTTSLIDSPLIRILRKKHKDDIRVDVHDLLHSVDGTVLHEILMKAKSPDIIWTERRFFTEANGWILSGQPDIFYKNVFGKKVLGDLKRCQVGAVRDGKVKREWIRQINIYRYLLHMDEIEVDELEMICWFKNPGYSDQIVQVVPVKMFSIADVKGYIDTRIALHKLCEDELTVCPVCTSDERWQKPTTYAVCTKSGKSIKNYDTKAEAEERAKTDESKYHIEERVSTPVRCKGYCDVSPFCTYYQDYLENGRFADLDEEIK